MKLIDASAGFCLMASLLCPSVAALAQQTGSSHGANSNAAAAISSVVIVIATPNPVVQGQTVLLTAGVNATLSNYPSGTITILDACGDPANPTVSTLGTITLASAFSPTPGSGTLIVNTFPCAGQNTLTGVYSGDTRYAPATSAPLIETVLGQFTPVTVGLTSSSNPVVVGSPVTFGSVLTFSTAQNSNATGTITFTDTNSGNVIGTATVQTAGGARQLRTGASFTTSSLPVGTYAIQASYSGDNIYGPSTSQILNQVVQSSAAESTSTVLTSSATTLNLGDSVTLNAQVTAADGPPGGTLTFLDGNASLAAVNLDGNGQATLTTSSLALGSHTITASYGGSSQFAVSTSGAVTITVNPLPLTPTATSLNSSANPATAGQTFTLSATVTTSGTDTPTGTISFQDTNSSAVTTQLGVVVLQNGTASLAIDLPADTHILSAVYSGDTSFNGSTATLVEAVIPPALLPTTTALSSSADPSTYGQPVTFVAIVSGSAGIPTGSVLFNDGPDNIAVILDANGVAVFTSSSLPAGSANVTATYSGDPVNAGSNSPTFVQTVAPSSTNLALTSSAGPVDPGITVTFTATLTAVAPGAGLPTGTITFQADGNSLQCDNLPVQQDGTATCSTSALPSGDHAMTAAYSGDANFLASSGSLTQTINMPAATGQLMLAPMESNLSQGLSKPWAKLALLNIGSQRALGAIQIFFNNLPSAVTVQNAQGSVSGVPYIQIPRSLDPGQSTVFPVIFNDPLQVPISYQPTFKTGMGSSAVTSH